MTGDFEAPFEVDLGTVLLVFCLSVTDDEDLEVSFSVTFSLVPSEDLEVSFSFSFSLVPSGETFTTGFTRGIAILGWVSASLSSCRCSN